MDANTPETRAMPSGNPNEGNPVHGEQSKPIQDAVNAPGRPPPSPAPSPAPTPPPPPPTGQATGQATAPARPKGPNASAIVLGLVALAMAGLIIASETMDLRIDWSALGPGAIIGIGVLLVTLGAIGLVRRNDSDR